jgi:O-antigen/teichoic acid export membrane protein
MSDILEPTFRRNTLINLVGGLVPAAVSLVTIPLYLDAVGQARYGVLAIVWLLLGYFGVFDIGLGRAAANRLAQLRRSPDSEQSSVFWTALAVNVIFGLLGSIVFAVAGYVLLDRVLKIPAGFRSEALRGLPFAAAAVPFVTASSVLTGALEGYERFLLANAVQVVAITVYQAFPLALAYAHGPDLAWLVAGAATAPVVGTALGLAVCLRYLPIAAAPRVERRLVRRLLGYGGWITVTGIVSPVLTIADRLVIGTISGARGVTRYTVPTSLVTRLGVVPLSVSRTLFPRLSMLPEDEARATAREAVTVLAAAMTPLVVLGLVVLKPFLTIWVGSSLAEVSAPVGEIVLIGVWINSLAFVPHAFLQARGRPDLPAKFHLLELGPYVGALWLGFSLGGIEGVAWAWTARVILDAALLFGAARIGRRPDRLFAVPVAIVATAGICSLLAFARPATRIALGGALVVASLGYAWPASRRLWHLVESSPVIGPDDVASRLGIRSAEAVVDSPPHRLPE